MVTRQRNHSSLPSGVESNESTKIIRNRKRQRAEDEMKPHSPCASSRARRFSSSKTTAARRPPAIARSCFRPGEPRPQRRHRVRAPRALLSRAETAAAAAAAAFLGQLPLAVDLGSSAASAFRRASAARRRAPAPRARGAVRHLLHVRDAALELLPPQPVPLLQPLHHVPARDGEGAQTLLETLQDRPRGEHLRAQH